MDFTVPSRDNTMTHEPTEAPLCDEVNTCTCAYTYIVHVYIVSLSIHVYMCINLYYTYIVHNIIIYTYFVSLSMVVLYEDM